MKIHQALLQDFIGRDVIETLCNRVVVVVRKDNNPEGPPIGFKTSPSATWPEGRTIQIVENPCDVTCNTCQHVWRKIR